MEAYLSMHDYNWFSTQGSRMLLERSSFLAEKLMQLAQSLC